MKTYILTSFAMANHGANFAHWLRDRLMKHYQLNHVNAVYVDSVVARSGNTLHAMSFDMGAQAPNGVARVFPDMRPHMKSETGANPIGAMRSDWDELYTRAMSEADVMLFAYTVEYDQSQWCMQEWQQFHAENVRRRNAKLPILRGVVLQFHNANNLIDINQTHISRVPVVKTDGGCQGLAWDKGDFILNPSDFSRVTAAIGKL